ncbi:MAG: dihydrofolate reductase family protein [Nannocystaceae bacterium]|nr:dihydrofolate reductase family protein [Nannocystaceae bacterium]
MIFDSRLRLGTAGVGELHLLRPTTLILHTTHASAAARRRLSATGVTLLEVGTDPGGHIDIASALDALGEREVRSLFVEGGGRLHGAFIAAGAWQRWLLYQAPKILGEGIAVVGGVSWQTVAESPVVEVESRRILGPDQLLVLRPGVRSRRE